MDGLITLLGGGLGGLLRLAPEIFKFFTAKGDRAHELAMFDKQNEADRLRSQLRIEETRAAGQVVLDAAGLEALKAGIEAQGKMTGNPWIDGINQLVRPIITFQWVIFLYPAVIVATYILMLQAGDGALNALLKVFGAEEKAMVSGIVNFWFLDRVIKHQQR